MERDVAVNRSRALQSEVDTDVELHGKVEQQLVARNPKLPNTSSRRRVDTLPASNGAPRGPECAASKTIGRLGPRHSTKAAHFSLRTAKRQSQTAIKLAQSAYETVAHVCLNLVPRRARMPSNFVSSTRESFPSVLALRTFR